MGMPSISHLLIHPLTQQRKARAPDGKGGFLENYEILRTLNGRINPAGPRELEIAQQKQAEVTHYIYLEPGTDVGVNDQFVYGIRIFRVTIPHADIPSIPIYNKVYTVEIQRGH